MPKPRPAEEKDAFITRFMGDETMLKEYPDAAQRRAVAESQWNKVRGTKMEEEIFAVGKWNGMAFDVDDLKQIAETFKQFRESHVMDVPLKLGHSGDKDLRDGQPALGWVSDVWVDEDAKPTPKLMARFEDMPKLVEEAVGKKMYKNKSIELDLDVEYKGKTYPYALTGIALLGADLPAVNTLNDLGAYMASTDHSGYAAFGRVAFSSEKGALFNVSDEETTMNEQEIAELKQRVADAEAQTAQFKKEADDAAQREQDRIEADKKAAFDKKVSDVKERMEQMVGDMKLLPADRTEFAASLTDDIACDKVSFALDLLEKVEIKPDKAAFGKGGSGDGEYTDPADETAKRIQEMQASNPKLSYSDAQTAVFRKDSKLAADYIKMT